MAIDVTNSSANLSGKTVMAAENDDTITGLKTFDRGAAAPFAVDAASTKVANLAVDYAAAPLDGQFAFPAVQNPSSGANVLDDYEEGTWTPVLAFGGASVGVTYGARTGRYTKIGNQVTIHFAVTLTSKGSSTGSASLTGLPFEAVSNPAFIVDFAGGGVSLTMPYFNLSGSSCGFLQITSGARAPMTNANFSGLDTFRGSATYLV